MPLPHPLRVALHNEVHARPYERLGAPLGQQPGHGPSEPQPERAGLLGRTHRRIPVGCRAARAGGPSHLGPSVKRTGYPTTERAGDQAMTRARLMRSPM